MALTSDSLIAKCRAILQDPYPGLRWTNDELVGWINAAQNSIAAFIPGTTAKSDENFPCQAGARQVLPDGAARLIRIIGNTRHQVGAADIQPARTIREGSFDDIDIQIPDWRVSSKNQRRSNGAFKYYFYDVDAPLEFYLFPISKSSWDGTGNAPTLANNDGVERLNLVYSQAPDPVEWRETGEDNMYNEISGTEVTVAQTTLMIPVIYEDAIINYVISRSLLKAPHTPQRIALANQREQAFLNVVQGARTTDVAVTAPDGEIPPSVA